MGLGVAWAYRGVSRIQSLSDAVEPPGRGAGRSWGGWSTNIYQFADGIGLSRWSR